MGYCPLYTFCLGEMIALQAANQSGRSTQVSLKAPQPLQAEVKIRQTFQARLLLQLRPYGLPPPESGQEVFPKVILKLSLTDFILTLNN